MAQINQSPPSLSMPTPSTTNNGLALKDIHLPEHIDNFPTAYGWWILAVLIITAIIFSIIKLRQRSKLKAAQRQALAQLQNNTELTASEVISIVKWACMQYFSRTHIAKLYGNGFKEFLLAKLSAKHQPTFTQLCADSFDNLYQSTNPVISPEQSKVEQATQQLTLQPAQQLQQAAIFWLTHALPPKKPKTSAASITTVAQQQHNSAEVIS